jgi:hypothetical protein
MKSAQRTLGSIARKADAIARQLDQLEVVSVSDLSRKWGKSKRWINDNLPIIKLGPKSHRVKLQDAVEFQDRRTIKP